MDNRLTKKNRDWIIKHFAPLWEELQIEDKNMTGEESAEIITENIAESLDTEQQKIDRFLDESVKAKLKKIEKHLKKEQPRKTPLRWYSVQVVDESGLKGSYEVMNIGRHLILNVNGFILIPNTNYNTVNGQFESTGRDND